jgi:hypothetical protein
MTIYSKKRPKNQTVQQVLWGVDPGAELGPGYSAEFRAVTEPVAQYVQKEVLTGTAIWGLKTYAMKRPLSFSGRVIGHAIPFIGVAMYAYDVYQLGTYIYDTY